MSTRDLRGLTSGTCERWGGMQELSIDVWTLGAGMHWGKKIAYSVCFTVLITFWAIVVAAIEKIKVTGTPALAYASLDPAFFNRSFDWMFAGFSMLFGGLVLSQDKRQASTSLVMGLVLAFTLFFVNVAFSIFHPYILAGASVWMPILVSSALGLLVLGICAGLS